MKALRILISLVALVALAVSALAQPLSYGGRTVKIKAGVLLVASQASGGVLVNPVPHLWYNLDQDRVNKPASWNITNPVGGGFITNAQAVRWGATAGNRVSKQDATYWEVKLDEVSDSVLAQYDILSLTLSNVNTLNLNSLEREKIRRYIDQGGILWFDLRGDNLTTIDPANGVPCNIRILTDASPLQADLGNPLLSYPNTLSIGDVANMNLPAANPYVSAPLAPGTFGGISSLFGQVIVDSSKLQPVAGTPLGSTISSTKIGDGYLVVTTRGVTAALARGYDPVSGLISANTMFKADNPVNDAFSTSAARFAVNLINLSSSYSSPGGGSRKTNSSKTTIAAPLLRRFSVPGGFTAKNVPVLAKGRMVMTSGNQMVCYVSNTPQDANGEGAPDLGLPSAIGSAADIVWGPITLGGTLSAPAYTEVANTTLSEPSGNAAVDQVWATDANGNVYVVSLLTGTLLKTITPPGNTGVDPEGPYAPTIEDGTAFVADFRSTDQLGRIWSIDVPTATKNASGGNDWVIFGSARFLQPSASPTVGLIPIKDNSGGADRVAYIATKPDTTNSKPCGMTSIWIGARGEAPTLISLAGTTLTLNTRASLQNLPISTSAANGVHLTVIKPNGDPFTTAEMAAYFTGGLMSISNGILQVTLTAAAAGSGYDFSGQNPVTGLGYRLDYNIDWSEVTAGTVPGDSYVRGNVGFADVQSGPVRRVIGSPALSATGNIGIVVTDPSASGLPGGSFYNLTEQGRGDFNVMTRFDLHDDISGGFPTNGLGTIKYPPAISDEDNLNVALPFLRAPISNLHFSGAPAIYGDTMYVMATGSKVLPSFGGAKSPTTVLMAFRANPDPPEFQVELGAPVQPGQRESTVTVSQPDLMRSALQASPNASSSLSSNSFTIERLPDANGNPGNIGRLTFNSLSALRNGTLTSCLAVNLPVLVRRAGGTDTLYLPEAPDKNTPNNLQTYMGGGVNFYPGKAAGKFNPLLWYTVFNGFGGNGAPVVTGQTLYVSGGSYLPSIIATGAFPPVSQGLIFGMDSQIAGNDAFLTSNSLRPWTNQLYAFKGSTGPFDFANITVASSFKWPQFNGLASPDDFRVRLLQATVDNGTIATMAGGDGTLAVVGLGNIGGAAKPNQVYAFSRSDFLVVDSGRIGRFDPSGNPIWATDKTIFSGKEVASSQTANVRTLSTPVRMYSAGKNAYWAVDAGGDAVFKVDQGGSELRTITGFKIHPQFKPGGMIDNETLKIKNPRDVMVFSEYKKQAQVAAVFAGETLQFPATNELWQHVVIADAGNNRVIELIDRFRLDNYNRILGYVRYQDLDSNSSRGGNADSDGNATAIGVLFWHSPEEVSGKGYSYNSLARTKIAVGAGTKQVFAFGFGNVQPGKVTFGLDNTGQNVDNATGFGGVVIYDGPKTKLITSINVPAIAANTYLGQTGPGVFNYSLPVAPQATSNLKLAGLKSVTLRYVDDGAGPTLAVMLTLAGGIYEVTQDNAGNWNVRWMLPREAYVGMRHPSGNVTPFSTAQLGANPTDFKPSHARRLDSGDVLIVNGFSGTKLNNSIFDGEVFIVDGTFQAIGPVLTNPGFNLGLPNLGFTSLSVKFELPPVQGIRGIVNPIFAERQ